MDERRSRARIRKRLLGDERGQVLVLFAVSLVALLGFVALVVDVGLLYGQRARAMNAAEAATVAGMQALPNDPGGAVATAVDYAVRNGYQSDEVSAVVGPDNKRLEVTVRVDAPLFFARVLGFESVPIAARTAAQAGAVRSLNGAVPLGVEKQAFVYGASYYLKNVPGYGGSYRGNFGGLALGGRGGNAYEENLALGYEGELQIGDEIDTEPGNKSGPTNSGIAARIDADPLGTYESHRADSPRVLKVPVVEWSTKGGRSTATVVGFAAFWLEGVGGSGRECYVSGKFMKLLTSSEDAQMGTGDYTSYDYGLYTYELVE